MRRYAEKTAVPVDRTRAEVQNLLERHDADQFIFGTTGGQILVAFEIPTTDKNGEKVRRRLRFLVPMPVMSRGMTELKVKSETRRRWRALLLVLKAKLEAVASQIVSFDEEFLAHIVIDGNTTVGDRFVSTLSKAIEQGGNMPPLLGAG